MITKEKVEKLINTKQVQEIKEFAKKDDNANLILSLIRFGAECREIGYQKGMLRGRNQPPEKPEG